MAIPDLKDLAIIVSGLITAVSTLCAVLVTSRFNLKLAKLNLEAQSKQKEEERKIATIEEIYLLFEQWQTNFSNIYLAYLRCYHRKLDYQSVLQLTNESTLLQPGDAQRLKMLMHLHFPDLAKAYESVDEARRRVVTFLRDPKDSKLGVKDFVVAQENFELVCAEFKSKISHLAQGQ